MNNENNREVGIERGKRTLASLHKKLDSIKVFIDQFNSVTQDVSEVNVRLEAIEQYSEKHELCVEKMFDILSSEVYEDMLPLFERFESKYLDIKAQLLKLKGYLRKANSSISGSYLTLDRHFDTMSDLQHQSLLIDQQKINNNAIKEPISSNLDKNLNSLEIKEPISSNLEKNLNSLEIKEPIKVNNTKENLNIHVVPEPICSNNENYLSLSRPSSGSDLSSINSPQFDKTVDKVSSHQLGIKIPHIKLPIFDGTYINWITFRDTFSAIVHNRADISDIVKFTLLLNNLKGEAKDSIGHITLSSEGYKKAWNNLIERFDNTSIIIDTHVDSLLKLPTCNKESALDLRKLCNACVCHITSLEACNLPLVGLAERMVINIVKQRIDNITRKEFESKFQDTKEVTWSNLLKFLQNKCFVLESLETSKSSNAGQLVNPYIKKSNNKMFSKTFVSTNVANKPTASNEKNKCFICKNSHRIFNCNKFLELSPENRSKQIIALKACVNCLYPTHEVANCRIPFRCKTCQGKHNTLLHYSKNSKSSESNSSAGQSVSNAEGVVNVSSS